MLKSYKLKSDFRASYPEYSETLLLSFAIKETQLVVRHDILCTQHNNAIGWNHLPKVYFSVPFMLHMWKATIKTTPNNWM